MKTNLIAIDSELLGRSVLSIEDFTGEADFAALEARYVEAHRPLYVSCKLPLDRAADIHRLEDHGFRFIECQIRAQIDLRKAVDTSHFPYRFERVKDDAELAAVMEIAGSTFTHDRFSIDPLLDPSFSGRRYRRYVRQSFDSPDEEVYALIEPASRRVVAFKTHRYLGNDEVLLLLGGVHPDLKSSGVGVMNTYFELEELRRRGIRSGYTHYSAANRDIVNLEVGRLGYQIVATYAVMRKIYR